MIDPWLSESLQRYSRRTDAVSNSHHEITIFRTHAFTHLIPKYLRFILAFICCWLDNYIPENLKREFCATLYTPQPYAYALLELSDKQRERAGSLSLDARADYKTLEGFDFVGTRKGELAEKCDD